MDASFGEAFTLTLLTDDPHLAVEADRAGVQRIGVDLETIGKAARQRGYDTRLSTHTWDDLDVMAGVVCRAGLFLRVNPIHDGTDQEVERALASRARVLMLPSFSTAWEVERFVGSVQGRARVIILVERAAAVARIREILSVPGVDEVMLGLNDLRLQFSVANHFEMLASPVVEMLASEVLGHGLPLSIGGVGRVGDDSLPVPVDLVLAQYPRLGATGAWLSRSFCRAASDVEFGAAVAELRTRLTEWSRVSPRALARARGELAAAAAEWMPGRTLVPPASSASVIDSAV